MIRFMARLKVENFEPPSAAVYTMMGKKGTWRSRSAHSVLTAIFIRAWWHKFNPRGNAGF